MRFGMLKPNGSLTDIQRTNFQLPDWAPEGSSVVRIDNDVEEYLGDVLTYIPETKSGVPWEAEIQKRENIVLKKRLIKLKADLETADKEHKKQDGINMQDLMDELEAEILDIRKKIK